MMDHSAYLHSHITSTVNAAAIAVHKALGPGFSEHIYEEAFCVELDRRRVAYQRQLPVRVRYCGVPVGLYRLDLLVEDKVVVEIKAIATIETVHLAIALAYLKATDLQVGMIVNFGSAIMRSRRVFRDLVMEKEGEKTGTKERQVLAASPRVAEASNQTERDDQA
jgi:GxxExxY protein